MHARGDLPGLHDERHLLGGSGRDGGSGVQPGKRSPSKVPLFYWEMVSLVK